MIREIEESDLEHISEVWAVIFGDNYEFRQLYKFYPHAYGLLNEKTVVFDKKEKQSYITSFVYLLPIQYVEASNKHNCWLVYKCGTIDKYRRQGVMSQLLEAAGRKAAENGIEGIVASPSTDSMWNLFKRSGFTLFSRKKCVVTEIVDTDNNLRLSRVNARQFHIFRRRKVLNSIEWDKNYSNLLFSQFEKRGCEVYSFTYFNSVGVLICHVHNDKMVVEEMTVRLQHSGKLKGINLQDMTNALCTYFNLHSVSYFLPENSKYIGNLHNSSLILSEHLKYSSDNYIYI